MQNISTCLSVYIQFHARDYMFQAKKYAYGTYPDDDDVNHALEGHKKSLIDMLERAIKDYNPEN